MYAHVLVCVCARMCARVCAYLTTVIFTIATHTAIHTYVCTYPHTACFTVGRCTVYTHSYPISSHSFGCFCPNCTLFSAGCYLQYCVLHFHRYVHIGDQTAILREGYWGSYNVPFYEDVFVMSGYAEMEKRVGPSMSHDLAPRAEIFRRDQGKASCAEQEVEVCLLCV